MTSFEERIAQVQEWITSPRFAETKRLYSARQIVEQRGTIPTDYPIARRAADGFFARLRELFNEKRSITTFGPYSPGQAVAMKRAGIEGIYLGGWATSAKGSITEDPGADLASYPLSQVPNEAAPIVRALLSADRNEEFARSRMSEENRKNAKLHDFRPFIIADADTGHGGEAHVRNLVRRFVEVGVPGYHIEDQKPGAKKCGHQGGKVLVPVNEQIKRLTAARFQLDVMGVAGLIVARTDAEAATLLEGRGDERDHPFILGCTNTSVPTFKHTSLAVLKKFNDMGFGDIRGHELYELSAGSLEKTLAWFDAVGVTEVFEEAASEFRSKKLPNIDAAIDKASNAALDAWQTHSGFKTFRAAVVDAMKSRKEEGVELAMSVEEWLAFAKSASFVDARAKVAELGLDVAWCCDHAQTPEGYYQIQGGMEYALARSIAVAPYCDLIWMETKTADIADAKEFAEALHAVYPQKMLAYNLSPSFNWDSTGMSDDEMRAFPIELGKLGYVFNFITYGGHQVDGLGGEEFAAALLTDGMLALAQLQRQFRLVESPYKTPQTLVGGKRLDGALMATSGRTATTKAMGKGSTQFQHLIQTELPPRLLAEWLEVWGQENGIGQKLSVALRPHRPGSEILELSILGEESSKVANVVFSTIKDRQNRNILSVRDQNTFHMSFRKKRLMALAHIFLIHRYKSSSVHYLTPTDDNHGQTEGMKALGIYKEVRTEVGQIIVAQVDTDKVAELVAPESDARLKLIKKS